MIFLKRFVVSKEYLSMSLGLPRAGHGKTELIQTFPKLAHAEVRAIAEKGPTGLRLGKYLWGKYFCKAQFSKECWLQWILQ